jgi:hypothetical protein
MEKLGVGIRNNKQRGEWAELVFMARAKERGFDLVRPWGESSPYDVGLEYAGRFMRVQVKSTTLKVCHSYVCNTRPCNRAHVYTVRQIDFLAAYVIPADAWYILPVSLAKKLKGNIWLSPHKKGHKYEPFLEAWALLKAWHGR